VIVIAAGILLASHARSADERVVHEGKSLAEWVKQLQDKDAAARVAAARALSILGVKATSAVPALIKATQDADSDVRNWAATALSRIGPDAKEAVPALEALLKDQVKGVRYIGANALGSIGSDAKAAVPALRKTLTDRDPWMRWHVALALGSIGDKAAVPDLVKAMDDKEYVVRKGAIEALERMGPAAKDGVAALLRKWEDDEDYELIRTSAARALKKIDPEAAKKAGIK
jgi:HEAT repeat protein